MLINLEEIQPIIEAVLESMPPTKKASQIKIPALLRRMKSRHKLFTPFNSHRQFGTVRDIRLGLMIGWATNDFPDAGIKIVQCANGEWFVEVDYGSRFDDCLGVSRPHLTPYVRPLFFSSKSDVKTFALMMIVDKYPALEGKDFTPWLNKHAPDIVSD